MNKPDAGLLTMIANSPDVRDAYNYGLEMALQEIKHLGSLATSMDDEPVMEQYVAAIEALKRR